MTPQGHTITIREATAADLPFIKALSPTLAGVAGLAWHDDVTVQQFQDAYIDDMMAEADQRAITLIGEKDGVAAGFIHARERVDEVSQEECGTVPLLAVTEAAQRTGIGKALIAAAENWALDQGFRLLHLEVFAANDQAKAFYDGLGFKAETINMIKPLR